LLGLLAATGAACARPDLSTRQVQQPARLPDQDTWEAEARAILLAALDTLRTLETFAAFRISRSADTGQRTASELDWDPPTHAAWAGATALARSLPMRASQLEHTVATSAPEPRLWRERRAFAESAHGILDAVNAVAAYRAAVDGLGPDGPGTAVLGLLDRAWAMCRAEAATWGVETAEMLGSG